MYASTFHVPAAVVKEANIIRSHLRRLKSYEAGRSIQEVQDELGLDEVIKLASNESPYAPFPQTLAVLEENLSRINRYPEEGAFLKERIAALLSVDTDNVLLGHGSNEIIRLFTQAVLGPDEEAVVPVPSFSLYARVAEILGGRVVKVPLKDHRVDLEAMKRAVTAATKVVFICNPNNPTGTIVGRQQVESFLEGLPGEILVVFDEAYFEFTDDPDYPDSVSYLRLAAGQKISCSIAVLRTFSKLYSLAGLRVGYGVAPAELVEVAEKIRDPHNVNTLAQLAALASLDEAKEIAERKHLNREGKRFLYRGFEKLGIDYVPSQANFIWFDGRRSSRDVFRELMHEGVIVRTGDVFGEGCENFIRVSVGTPDENRLFLQALKKIMQ